MAGSPEDTPLAEGARTEQPGDAGLPYLLDACRDSVVFIDEDGKIVRFNRAAEKMFGCSASDVVGGDVTALMPEPHAAQHTSYVRRYEETGEARAIGRIRRVQARRANGALFPIELSVTKLPPGAGARYAAFIRDVTEREQMHHELVEKERLAAIGLGTSVFAHELGNPLNSLGLHAQLLHRALVREEHPAAVKALTITEEIRRLSEMLQEFRSVGRRRALNLERVDVAELVFEVAHMYQLPQSPGLAVKSSVAEDLPTIHADRNKMKQVLINLCKNAVEAMADGGTLRLEADSDGQDLTVVVRDTGGGIADGVDVFKPFHTTKKSGTGLGLAIARDIVLAHGGSIRVDSRSGEGAAFSITIPVEQHHVD